MFNLRANSLGQIAVANENGTRLPAKYSPFVLCYRAENSPPVSLTNSPNASGQPTNSLSPPPNNNSPPTVTLPVSMVLPVQELFKAILECLEKEREWHVLKLVLGRLPEFLSKKAIVLLCGNSKIPSKLCNAVLDLVICALIILLRYFVNVCLFLSFTLQLNNRVKTAFNEFNITKADFQCTVYPVLAALVGYQSEFDQKQQVSFC